MTILAALFFGTFVAEDLTSLTAAMLVQQGRVDPAAAILATGTGIYVGDLGLWLLGRLAGARVFNWPFVSRTLGQERLASFGEWCIRRAPAVLLASRFVPGTRLPMYIAAGALPGTFRPFALWTAVAVAVWTPAVILTAASGLVAAVAVVALMILRLLPCRLHILRRERMLAAISRLWRWEFWPMWLFYPPVAAWTAWLALRYGGYGTISAANPGIQDGGIVGESKFDILRRLPPAFTVPSARIEPGVAEERSASLERLLTHSGFSYPLVLKPDVGQRGTGVKVVRSPERARQYLAAQHGAVIVQPYHPGPHEAGVFYVRKPSWTRGLILSITDKRFPVVTGDGVSSLEDLIWRHPRYRMQARVFLKRHESSKTRVLPAGETFPLARAGNHAQGTMFLDGGHLITPALEARIDRIARSYPGFFIGRFDIRYGNAASFCEGRDFAIVELNGATAECTELYDPSRSLLDAYRILFRQWRLVFEIGAANRARGARTSSPGRLFALMRAHALDRPAHAISD